MPSASSPPASEAEAASSPARPDKSFMTNATEDDDTRMPDATPEPAEKHHRGKARGHASAQTPQQQPVIGKIRHLKKNDGEPLWREDIQYDFLKAIFDDEQKVFTNSFEPERLGKQCFADLYIDTMSRSSKTSKVLRDKLLSDRDAAKGMAMVCLLVNIGRMNTTLNFFPEMRAQLRTYHAIPSLQAHQDSNAYKQLQDAPRLKSILKGGAEDRPEPNTLDKIKAQDIPRTNPVNLLFVIIQNASKIAELHFPTNHEFHDLVMKTQYSSASRARAFLWIMWFYLESDFTEEGCEENPFGPGVDYGLDVANQGIPRLQLLKPGDPPENVDTLEEKEFGEEKKRMRAKIIDADKAFINDSQSKRGARPRVFMANGPDDLIGAGSPSVLPRMRPSRHESDLDSTRSTPPPRSVQRQLAGPVSGARRSGALKYQIYEAGSSPAPAGAGSASGGAPIEGVVAARKPRPPTAHQIAVENNRTQRVNHIIDRGVRKAHHYARKQRRVDGAIFRALRRLRAATDDEHPIIPDPVDDSEGEETFVENQRIMRAGVTQPDPALHCGLYHGKKTPYRSRGFGGLCLLQREDDDFGEEATTYAAAFRRAARRLERWHENGPKGVVRPIKRPRVAAANGVNGRDPNETEDEMDQTMDQSMDQTMTGMDDSMAEGPADEDEFTIDTSSVLTPRGQLRRKRGAGMRIAALTGSARRKTTASPARGSGASKRSKPAVNGSAAKSGSGQLGRGDVETEDADELEDVDKQLLGMASGSEAEDGEGDAGDKDMAKDTDDEGDNLDDIDKTLLGIGDDASDSD